MLGKMWGIQRNPEENRKKKKCIWEKESGRLLSYDVDALTDVIFLVGDISFAWSYMQIEIHIFLIFFSYIKIQIRLR